MLSECPPNAACEGIAGHSRVRDCTGTPKAAAGGRLGNSRRYSAKIRPPELSRMSVPSLSVMAPATWRVWLPKVVADGSDGMFTTGQPRPWEVTNRVSVGV